MKQNYINHISVLVDGSGSMRNLIEEVNKVLDAQVKNLAKRSQEMDQETRISIYQFDDVTECLVYDKDVLRLPSVKDDYKARGGTALIDATLKSIEDLEKTATLYGDHSFLVIVLTDGEENRSSNSAAILSKKISSLPENWTFAAFVPNAMGVAEIKKFGFPSQNVQVWNTDNAGVKEVGRVVTQATDNYMKARSTGIRGTKNLFNFNNISTKAIKNTLDEVDPSSYETLLVRKYDNGKAIKDFVESWTKNPYRLGSAYYQLSKPEKIQPNKVIAIKEVKNGKIYSGLNARNMLGLPNYEVKVAPADYKEFEVFVQSNSTNRKLVADTQLIVMK